MLVIEGAGLPHLRSPKVRGDLRIGVCIDVPTKLTATQRELLEQFAKTAPNPDEELRPAGKGVWKKIKDTISGS